MKIALITLLFSILFSSFTFAEDQAALEERLSYLNDIPEISWVIFKENHVYIGFISYPTDIGNIVNAAALHGNRAYGFGVHIYACPASELSKIQEGRSDWLLYCTATARHGKIEKNTCH